MKLRVFVVFLFYVIALPSHADEPASSKELPVMENGFVGYLCDSELDGEPASSKLVTQAVDKVNVSTQGAFSTSLANSIKRVAIAYAYRDRNHGGSCLTNVQGEYWAPKNQPK